MDDGALTARTTQQVDRSPRVQVLVTVIQLNRYLRDGAGGPATVMLEWRSCGRSLVTPGAPAGMVMAAGVRDVLTPQGVGVGGVRCGAKVLSWVEWVWAA